jgi:hypothetical protein
MADYNVLKSSVAAVIKTNNRREITGQLLQNVLTQMINVIGDNYQLAGFADPTTNPQSPDQNVFYVAEQSGVYPYFDNIIVPEGVTFLMWKNSQWTAHTIGVVTTEYLSENYVTKEFFRSMFRAYDSNGVEIEPNNDGDEPYTIDNIKAMVGFWTNEYISALGQGSGGGGGGGSTSLAGLTDVAINPQTLAGGQALVYNGTTHKWENGSAVINMASVWSALGASTNEQINASHLSSALQGFATETWVSQNYISIAYFDRLFRAYNGNVLVNHNDEESTIDNIKAMFGFWTEQYLSALGNSGGGSVSLTLANMGDVSLNNLADGQVLTYNATTGKWVNANPQGGVTDLASLTDVTLTTPSANQVLLYDGTTSKWINSGLKTINGQSIYGSGDISVGGGASGNYLPLSGGTLTNPNYGGQLTIHRSASGGNPAIKYTSSNGFTRYLGFAYDASNNNQCLYYTTEDITHKYWVISKDWIDAGFFATASGTSSVYVGAANDNNYISILAATRAGLYINTSTNFPGGRWLISGYSRTQKTFLENGNVLIGDNMADVSPAGRLHVAGSIFTNDRLIIGNGDGSTRYNTLIANSEGQFSLAASLNGVMRFGYRGGNYILYLTTSGNCGIGTSSPSYKLHVNGTLGAGNTSVANLESEGYVSALSDIRKKEVVEHMDGLTIEQIASMPIIKFTWKDRPEEGLQVGSVAQEWQRILPQSVHKSKDDYLSFSYGVAALVGTISNSRELVKHDARLSRIEKMLNINID